ncbi:PHB depolymerase family esterase [Teichococcus deserti]|uniref:extracellular catalytic domain type 1 short-chain-length polyhydroxyalkanoate depolymerase n=1 Tax=Teichococcus deserti TaxID=1817963 RepID=UPI0009770592|nr:PHB depolymerase family esterase [Pseudoroseomonas deserti]
MRISRQPNMQGAWTQTGSRLVDNVEFGSNPGGLRMLSYVPQGLPPGAPLVVALHGCTQTATDYDRGCGWSDMAERSGFALLMPEQRRANNAHLCFNWFEPGDTGRDRGEALSIRQMINQMLEVHALDPRQVYISGLSAGGAMTSVMLACYPEVFAAGAVIAGLPHGAASNVQEALGAMARPLDLPATIRARALRSASSYCGVWPRVAVWHGEADTTVHPGNAEEVAKQWLGVHNLAGVSPQHGIGDGGEKLQRWFGEGGAVQVAVHRVVGLGHGMPIAAGRKAGQCGEAGPYVLEAGCSATHGILAFWGLPTGGDAMPKAEILPPGRPEQADPRAPLSALAQAWHAAENGPAEVISRALRAAGLLRR